jgi:HNH endonuclease
VPTCIYCQRTDPPRGFNIEHVIPEALGAFRDNLTLSKSEVCWDCNDFFNRKLDVVLTRDSSEALLRFPDLKDPAQVNGMFTRRVRLKLLGDDPDYHGMQLGFEAPEPGEAQPRISVLPQVGFERRDGTGWDYFTETTLPGTEELQRRREEIYTTRVCYWTYEQREKDRLRLLLAERAVPLTGQQKRVEGAPLKNGRADIEINSTFDSVLARAIAKIAFNYLAYTQGAPFALRGEFGAARRFVRYGEGDQWDFVRFIRPPGHRAEGVEEPRPRGHHLALDWAVNAPIVVCGFSPFLDEPSYLVRLGLGFADKGHPISSGHFFDLATLQVTKLTRVRTL